MMDQGQKGEKSDRRKRDGKKRASFSNILIRLLPLTFLVCVVLFSSILLAVSSGWKREAITDFAELKLGELLRVEIEIESIEGPILPWLKLRGVSLRGISVEADMASGPKLLDATAIELRVTPLALLRRKLVIDDVMIESPRFAAARDFLQKDANASEERPPVALPISIELRQLTLRNGSFRLDMDALEEASETHAEGRFELELLQLEVTRDVQVSGPEVASLELELERSEIIGRPIESARAEFELVDEVIVLRAGSVQLSGLDARLEGEGRILSWIRGVGNAELDLRSTVDALDPSLLFGMEKLASTWRGEAAVRLNLPSAEPLSQALIEGSLALDGDVQIAKGKEEQKLRLSGRFHAGKWQVEAAELRSRFAEARFGGKGDSKGIERLRGELRVPELAALEGIVKRVPPLVGAAELRFSLEGPWAALQSEGELAVRELAAQDVVLGDLDIRVAAEGFELLRIDHLALAGPQLTLESVRPATLRWKDGQGELRDLELASDGQELRASGGFSAQGLNTVELHAKRVELAPLVALANLDLPLSGQLDAEFHADGPFAHPELKVKATLRDPVYGEARAEEIRLALRSESGNLIAELETDQAGRTALHAEVTLPYVADTSFHWKELLTSEVTEMNLRGKDIDLAQLGPFLREQVNEIAGLLDVDLTLRGAQPLPEIHGTLAIDEGVLALVGKEERFAPIRLQAEVGEVHLVELQLGEGEDMRRLATTFGLEQVSRGEHAIRLAEFEWHGPRLQVHTEGTANAILYFEAGHPNKTHLDIEELVLASGEGRLGIVGRVQPQALEGVELTFSHLELTPIAKLVGIDQLVGTLDGELALDGKLPLPSIQGSLAVSIPESAGVPLDTLQIDFPQLEGNLLRAEARLLHAGEELLSAQAALPYLQEERAGKLTAEAFSGDPRTQLSLRADAVDLAWFAPFMSRWARDLSGVFNADLHYTGGVPVPAFRGTASLEDGSFSPLLFDQRIDDVFARLTLEEDRIEIERFQVGDAEHGAELVGYVDLADGLHPGAHLELVLNEYPISLSRRMNGLLHGRVQYTGALTSPVVEGKLELRETRLYLPEEDDSFLREIRVMGLESEEARLFGDGEASGLFDGSQISLELIVPRNTWVHQGESSFEIEGEAELQKSPNREPRYFGELRLVRGRYRFQGRTLDLREGFATFPGSTKLDPQIYALAEYRVKDVRITATFSGWLSDPRMQLQSDPVLSQEEILSYLMFGEPISKLSNFDSGKVGLTASSLARSLGATTMTETMGGVLPVQVDEFSVSMNENQRLSLEVGSYITPYLFVRYQTGYGSDEATKFHMRWLFSRNFSLETTSASDDTSAADVIWTFEY